MKVIITGTTGYVGEGVMLACLDNEEVTEVLSVSRRTTGKQHPKLKEMLVSDFLKIPEGDERLQGYNAVFFCMGVSSVGMNEADYTVACHDIPVHFAKAVGPKEQMAFIYVTGGGADVNPDSKTMWARVKGRTEADVAKMGFKETYGFRVGIMKPYKGMTMAKKSMMRMSQLMYPVMRLLGFANTLDEVARAMIACAKGKADHSVITVKDVTRLAKL